MPTWSWFMRRAGKEICRRGKLLNRRLVMYNDFIIIGPKDDPAKSTLGEGRDRLRSRRSSKQKPVSYRAATTQAPTRWKRRFGKPPGIDPKGAWYIEAGQGMGATLGIANERNAYTITDRGTYLALGKRVSLPILIEGDKALLNIYSVMEVNPANGPRVNSAGGKAFADFMVAPQTQNVIRSFGVEKFGQSLFVPVAGKKEDELGV